MKFYFLLFSKMYLGTVILHYAFLQKYQIKLEVESHVVILKQTELMNVWVIETYDIFDLFALRKLVLSPCDFELIIEITHLFSNTTASFSELFH